MLQQCRFLRIFSKRLVMKMDRRRRRRRRRRPTFVITYNDVTVVLFTIDRCHPTYIPDIIRLSILLVTPTIRLKSGPFVFVATRATVDVSPFYYFSGGFFTSASPNVTGHYTTSLPQEIVKVLYATG